MENKVDAVSFGTVSLILNMKVMLFIHLLMTADYQSIIIHIGSNGL
jgi:hypothetical protein